jgi:hypothetical protein
MVIFSISLFEFWIYLIFLMKVNVNLMFTLSRLVGFVFKYIRIYNLTNTNTNKQESNKKERDTHLWILTHTKKD